MDNPGYQHDDPGAALHLQQRPLPGPPGAPQPDPSATGGNGNQSLQAALQAAEAQAQPLHQPLYHALSQQERRAALAARRSRSLRAPRRPAPAITQHDDPSQQCTLNNSRVSLASWSSGPSPSGSPAPQSPAAPSPRHTPPLSREDIVRNNPAVFLNNHQNALKVRRNFVLEYHAHTLYGYAHAPCGLPADAHLSLSLSQRAAGRPDGAKLHPLRNALGPNMYPQYHSTPLQLKPSPILQVCNNQLAPLGPPDDTITTKKPCRCPPEEPVHEYSSIIGPLPLPLPLPHAGLPHKASSLPAAASTEPLYWSPILKRAAGVGGGSPGGGPGGRGPNATTRLPGDEGTLKKGWNGTSRVFKYIVQRRGRPRRGWRWLLWLLGAGAVTLLVAVGLAAYFTAGFGLLRSTEAALRDNGVVSLAGEFRVLSERWAPELADMRSAAWRTLSNRIQMQLDSLFAASPLAALYRRSAVTSLRPAQDSNAVDVDCDVEMSDAALVPDLVERAGLAFLRGLRHRAGRAWLGDLAVDVQSIGFVGAPPPPNSAPVERAPRPGPGPAPTTGDPSVPGWAEWSAWSECYLTGSADNRGGGTMVRLRSRACALDGGRGRPLDGPEPCMLRLPTAGSHFEMETCPHLQPAPGAPTAATILIQDTVMAMRPAKPPSSTAAPASSRAPPPPPPPSSQAIKATVTPTVITSTAASASATSTKVIPLSSTEPSPSPFSMTTLLVPVIVTENTTTTSTTTESAHREPRHCDECVPGEVCVALSEEAVPRCHPIKDSQDPTGCGGLCKLNFEFCQRLDVDAFRCVDDSVCLPGEWRCGNQLCIPLVKRCDGHLNCYDHTDEHNCECNLQTHFQCGNKTSCLPRSKRCDGIVDCWDAADELNCTRSCPHSDQFTCSNGNCIPHTRFCDGFSDCSDKSDEPFGCGGDCKNHEWKCGNGRCIRKRAVCNGLEDCGDGSDERECRKSRPPGS